MICQQNHLNRKGVPAIRRAILAAISLILVIITHQLPVIAQSQPITQARITEILQSNQVYIQNRQAKVMEFARSGEQIRTGLARASLRFNTGAIGRLGNNAILTVGRQCFQLRQGQILVNGAANGCSRSYVAGVRGTVYLLDIDQQGQEQFTVLEGTVELTRRDRPSASPILLSAGRRLATTPQGQAGNIQTLTQQEYDSILQGDLLQNFSEQLPGVNALRQTYETLYPGATFPIPITDTQRWKTKTTLSRTTNAGQPAIALQLDVLHKPETTYANAVYQLYAYNNNQWIPIYSNLGARLLSNAPGRATPPAEIIPLSVLRLDRLGLSPDTTALRGVVRLRYDLPHGNRDQTLVLDTENTYPAL